MKRKAAPPTTAPAPAHRRRQPQISCDFCRNKKLKCDRGRPCLNCAVRKLPCAGDPDESSNGTTQNFYGTHGTEVLERLRRLEQAVFRRDGLHDTGVLTPETETRSEILNNHGHRRLSMASQLAIPGAASNCATIPDLSSKLTFRIPSTQQLGSQGSALHNGSLKDIDSLSGDVGLPTKEDALSLFDDYVENASYLLRIVHEPTARKMILDTYDRLSRGQQVELGVAALILSMCASSAFLWTDKGVSSLNFKTAEEAAHQSFVWRKATWDILDQSRRLTTKSLEAIQAGMILAEQIYSLEGHSSGYHYLHSSSIFAARQMSLHLIDAPNQPCQGDIVTREYKRRIWWYLASTDWLLGIMNGPLDRTYTVNPRHMHVKYPRHLNDKDVATFAEDEARPDTQPTEMSIFIQRIRMADTCRRIIDGLPLGMGEIDGLPYEQVEALDQLFEYDLMNLFPALRHPKPLPAEAPPKFALQQETIQLAYHARRARLLRPFLRPGPAILEPVRDRLRATCLKSAHAVLKTASTILQECLEEPTIITTPNGSVVQKQPSSHRNGCIINHLFMSCIILATDPTLSLDASGMTDAEAETRRTELAATIRLLEKAGKDSVMVANMLRDLIGVLRRPRSHGAEIILDTTASAPAQVETGVTKGTPTIQDTWGGQNVEMDESEGNGLVVAPDAKAEWNLAEADSIDLNAIWDEFLGNIPMEDGWDQLFADLDTFEVPI